MTKYYVIYLNQQGQRIGMTWTYNKTEIKGLCRHAKKYLPVAGVQVGTKTWMF